MSTLNSILVSYFCGECLYEFAESFPPDADLPEIEPCPACEVPNMNE
ncbi:hypothetical protein [Streptomyces sp. CBMA123]|nr:hypothetical protein [Streptomyces sp. CBMA123]